MHVRRRDTWLTRGAILFSIAFYLFYLHYRISYTINWESPTPSLLLLYAEIHGLISLALFGFQVWRPIKREAPAPEPGLSVDVYIPTVNEDPLLLRKTVVACLRMHYPHKTYILDDGNRDEVRQMAEELGCGYITRSDRNGAKAGNLNNAMAQTSGDFIASFDADDVPREDYLLKTLGYFTQENLAFVQVPQHPYNSDSFSFQQNTKRKVTRWENDIFFNVCMPGLDYWGAAYCVGTGVVFRRQALDSIGGFATESITEDLLTSIQLYQEGWKSAYHHEYLVTGLATADLRNYHRQKLRWCEGNVQCFMHAFKIRSPGTTVGQRLGLFSVFFSWFSGFPKLIFYITPPLMLLTGSYPIANYDMQFFLFFCSLLAVLIGCTRIASRGQFKLANSEQYELLNFFRLIQGVIRALFTSKLKFDVTGKGAQKGGKQPDPVPYLAPQVALILLGFSGAVWGVLKLSLGTSHDILGVSIASILSLGTAISGTLVVKKLLRIRHHRDVHRVTHSLPVEFVREGDSLLKGVGVTINLHEMGILLLSHAALAPMDELDVTLTLDDKTVTCRGLVRFFSRGQNGERSSYGIEFLDVSEADRDNIAHYCFNRAVPQLFHGQAPKASLPVRLWYRVKHWLLYRRRQTRCPIVYPVRIKAGQDAFLASTDDLSLGGLSFVTGKGLQVDQHIDVNIEREYADSRIAVQAIVRQTQAYPGDGLKRYGVSFVETSEDARQQIRELLAVGGKR